MPAFNHDGIQFYYERLGSGPSVVFCHGLTSDCQVIKRLLGDLNGYELVVWDCRGHGRTEPVGPHDAFSFRGFAADLHALIEHLGIERAIVGGSSMGAAIATRFTLDRPHMVTALALIRPAWLDRPSPEPLRLLETIGDLLEQFPAEEGRRRFESLPAFQTVREVDPLAAAAMLDLFSEPRAAERSVRLRRIPRDCPIDDWQDVKHLSMPALVVGCEPDYVHPLSYAQAWTKRLPLAEFVQVPAKSQNEAKYTEEVRSVVHAFVQRISLGKQ